MFVKYNQENVPVPVKTSLVEKIFGTIHKLSSTWSLVWLPQVMTKYIAEDVGANFENYIADCASKGIEVSIKGSGEIILGPFLCSKYTSMKFGQTS